MAKKQLIMDKALELFAEQGFEATSIQQITDRCGISKGAFYLSFKSKDELIEALIDHFMMQITAHVDCSVRMASYGDDLLYRFYYSIYEAFYQSSDFAKILVKEQLNSVNENFIDKVHYYERLLEKTILYVIERTYGDTIAETKYDVLYTIKGFMTNYAEFFVFHKLPLDLDVLARSLVEKTNLIARNNTIPFITPELFRISRKLPLEDIPAEQIVERIDASLNEIEDPIIRESLSMLKEDLLEPALNAAVIKGLIENIRHYPQCKWAAYLLFNHYRF